MTMNNVEQEISMVQLISIIKRKLSRRKMRMLSTSYPNLSPTNSAGLIPHNSITDYYSTSKDYRRPVNRYSYLDNVKTSEEAWRTFKQKANSSNEDYLFYATEPIDTPPKSPTKPYFPMPYTGHYTEYLRKRELDNRNNRNHAIGRQTSFIPISLNNSEEQVPVENSIPLNWENQSRPKLNRNQNNSEKSLRKSCQQEINELQLMIMEIKQKVSNIYNPESPLFQKLSQIEQRCSKNDRKRATTTGSHKRRKESASKITSA